MSSGGPRTVLGRGAGGQHSPAVGAATDSSCRLAGAEPHGAAWGTGSRGAASRMAVHGEGKTRLSYLRSVVRDSSLRVWQCPAATVLPAPQEHGCRGPRSPQPRLRSSL